jgi:hypothetical protein
MRCRPTNGWDTEAPPATPMRRPWASKPQRAVTSSIPKRTGNRSERSPILQRKERQDPDSDVHKTCWEEMLKGLRIYRAGPPIDDGRGRGVGECTVRTKELPDRVGLLYRDDRVLIRCATEIGGHEWIERMLMEIGGIETSWSKAASPGSGRGQSNEGWRRLKNRRDGW